MWDFQKAEELEIKIICVNCINEPFLSREIKLVAQMGKCSYCDEIAETISLGDLANRVELAFEQHYVRTSDQPTHWQYSLQADSESNYDWDRDGEPVTDVIAHAAGISNEAAGDVQSILEHRLLDIDSARMGEECEFSSDSHYEEKSASDRAWREQWIEFERSLKTEARFFNQDGIDHLKAVFDGLHAMQTHSGRPLVVKAGPGTKYPSLFRARVFQSPDRLLNAICKPDKQLGPPPAACSSAGRMNAHGISVFYGATSLRIALAEVRPPVGSRVALAQFEILRPLKLLDLTAIDAVSESGSIFDPTYAVRLERVVFLRSLGDRISKAVMPDDQSLEYLPTQAVADFLATLRPEGIDGIVFHSAQGATDGANVVLFHKAARVERIELPSRISVHAMGPNGSEDDPDDDYTVWEDAPTRGASKKQSDTVINSSSLNLEDIRQGNGDHRDVTLRINLTSLEVHHITNVEVVSRQYSVRRYRSDRALRKY